MLYRIAESATMKSILLTGGTGFLGSALLRALALEPSPKTKAHQRLIME